MALQFKDRSSKHPGRYQIIWGDKTSEFVELVRADEPYESGTPLTAETFNALLDEAKKVAVSYIVNANRYASDKYAYKVDVLSSDIEEALIAGKPIFTHVVDLGLYFPLVHRYFDNDYSLVYVFGGVVDGVETKIVITCADNADSCELKSYEEIYFKRDDEGDSAGLSVYPVRNPSNSPIIDSSQIDVPDYVTPHVFDLLIDTSTGNLWRITGRSATGSYTLTLLGSMSGFVDKTLAKTLVKTVEGENFVVLSDVSPLSHDISLELTSDTDTKVTLNVIGKNIIDPPWVSGDPYTTQGVTFDTKDDNSVVIIGKATGDAYFKFETNKKLVPGTYTLKVLADNDCVTNGCVVPTMNKIDSSNKSTYMGADTGSGYTFTVTEEDSEAYVYGLHFTVVSSKNYNFNGERFYTMLVCGDKVPTEYEPYVLYEFVETKPSLTPITLSSHEPDMTIFAATSGVTLKATYNRDLAKVIGRIETALGL